MISGLIAKTMSLFRVEVVQRRSDSRRGGPLAALLCEAGLGSVAGASASRLYYLEGSLDRADVERVAAELLADPVTESAVIAGMGDALSPVAAGTVAFEVHPRPGVMDPVAESTLAELRAEGIGVERVRTARRYLVRGQVDERGLLEAVGRVLANDCIEEVVLGTAGVRPAPSPPVFEFKLRTVALRGLDDAALERLSRDAHLFLSRDEMRAIRSHFDRLGRAPTDLELETLAQTWSEHCVHKTLRSAVLYRGTPLPNTESSTRRYANLLRETIVRATEELMAAGRGPRCLSVFKDNAGVMAFDDEFGIAFKVETHNHPSAIEPYGGAATGIGGVIRDIIGCGLGAKPIASTDVFCVAPSDWPRERLPKGVLHPWRILRGVVRGVADYGNRMGIPTVNGAVCFDPRYLGNPLVFCGSVGLIPRGMVTKAARAGDRIVLIGGRTGRDGIHGATFSSAELTDTHADEFSHAVQIGNAITEKRFLDAVLQARDAAGGCLYTAITDCGAGGLSSAVGEMGEEIGAVVDLGSVPLKYAGLRYDEIWISEAQERMVVAVPPANLAAFLDIMRGEEVEATVIGTFGAEDRPRLIVRYAGHVVGELDMAFLHHGLPRTERVAEWRAEPRSRRASEGPPASDADTLERLRRELARPTIASKDWIIRQYDHEVQGGSVVKPLLGAGRGPGDAAVLRPRLTALRGIALGCGVAPHLGDEDPYWMAAAAIDEAMRNVVSVGGDPDQTALLDNFCWGRSDDPRQLGALVRACQACYDVAKEYGTPFISGKDSLNNEFVLDEADVAPLLETLRRYGAGPAVERHVAERRRLAIPPTLLISALSIVRDVRNCVTPDLKTPGQRVLLVGGFPPVSFSLASAARAHRTLADLMHRRLVVACHDVSDGGWLVALAEMALAGNRGVVIDAPAHAEPAPFDELCAAYLVETPDVAAVTAILDHAAVSGIVLATTCGGSVLRYGDAQVPVADLHKAWAGTTPGHYALTSGGEGGGSCFARRARASCTIQ
jgi:phosphoribosylformylglycinamidine synthase II